MLHATALYIDEPPQSGIANCSQLGASCRLRQQDVHKDVRNEVRHANTNRSKYCSQMPCTRVAVDGPHGVSDVCNRRLCLSPRVDRQRPSHIPTARAPRQVCQPRVQRRFCQHHHHLELCACPPALAWTWHPGATPLHPGPASTTMCDFHPVALTAMPAGANVYSTGRATRARASRSTSKLSKCVHSLILQRDPDGSNSVDRP